MTTIRFDADALIAEAIATAGGLDDFGEVGWREGLDRLLDDLAVGARLNDVGVEVVRAEVRSYLDRRLRIVDHRNVHPEIAAGRIERPIVIVGQPRTGTTILYDLLAQDPQLRAPLSWEVDSPVPPPDPATYETDPRIDECQAQLDLVDTLLPGFTAFHDMGASLAQECVRMTGAHFTSMIFPVQYRVREYNRWLLEEVDMASTYRWHRSYLQHLQSGFGEVRWLLKTPAHLWHLPNLMAEYPDAVVIQTHRDPLKVVASIAALTANLRRLASDATTIPEAAEDFAEDLTLGLDRSLVDDAAGVVSAEQLVHVQFAEFVTDQLGVVERIYEQLDLDLSGVARDRMAQFLVEHAGDGGGAGIRYSWADTGMDADALRERVRPYQERFSVPSEPVR